jgi:periplasmic protein TonB
MEPKKTAKADLGKKTFLFFNIGLIVALLSAIFAFNYKSVDDTRQVDLEITSITEDPFEVLPTDHTPTPPPQRIEQPIIKEVPNDEMLDEIPIDMDNETDATEKKDVIPFVPIVEEPEEDPETIFIAVEESAAPADGLNSFYDFVSKKIKYPAQAKRMGIEGKVFVQFIIEKDGSLSEVTTIKGIGGGCDEEAERILRMAPKWKPGKQRGKPVRQKMVLPITFRMN